MIYGGMRKYSSLLIYICLGPALGSTHIYCSRFEKTPQNSQECAFGDEERILWKYSDSKDCRNKCTEIATFEGPGCCAFTEEGVCSYHTKGTIVNVDSTSGVNRATYCVRRYDSGKSTHLP